MISELLDQIENASNELARQVVAVTQSAASCGEHLLALWVPRNVQRFPTCTSPCPTPDCPAVLPGSQLLVEQWEQQMVMLKHTNMLAVTAVIPCNFITSFDASVYYRALKCSTSPPKPCVHWETRHLTELEATHRDLQYTVPTTMKRRV